jgi:hypothetical protein
MCTPEALHRKPDSDEGAPEALECRLAALSEVVMRLEGRVAKLERTAPKPVAALPIIEVNPSREATVVAESSQPTADLPNPVHLMGLIGRTCLILGGATFIRALVDAGTIYRGWGVALGLAYAITWALLAARAKHPLDSAFHALASVLIAYPLIVESTARFNILAPGLSAVLLLFITCLHGFVAWRRDLKLIIWAATLASIGSGLAMMSACRSIEPFLSVFLVLGACALWGTYGRRWHGLRWPTALAADLGVLILTSLAAWPGGIPETYRGISPARTILFALALALIYIGSFAVRMLQHRRVVNAFEVVQTVLVLLVGFGGACRVASASGSDMGLLGAGITVAAIGCYGTAIPFSEDREEIRANFQFFTFLAQVFLLLDGLIALPMPIFGALSGVLGFVAMLFGLRRQRAVLMVQSTLYLLASGLASGLATWSLRAFLAPVAPASPLSLAAILSLGCLAISLMGFLLYRPEGSLLAKIRPLMLCLGAGLAGGLGALLIRIGVGVLAGGGSDPSVLAVVRTGVLSTLILALAWCGRRIPVLELKWLVYPVMIITALKFLFEDLAVGRPLTLFLGFMCYGATLMLAPRLLKAPVSPDRDKDANSPKPEVDS